MNRAMQLKDKIKNLASKNHIPAQAVLQNFMLECLLDRISVSKYREIFVLKGGMLIASLVGISNRTTMDMDATLRDFPLSEETVREVFSEICAIPMEDEVTLTLDHILPIREEDEYAGYRVAIIARYESINTPLKIDITTGDVITPRAVRYEFHSILSNKRIKIWAYNLETILAEKMETILRRSVLNTRPRDFYDVYVIVKTKHYVINRKTFITALKATAERRGSLQTLPDKERILAAIQSDPTMQQRWARYCRENYFARGIEFNDVIGAMIEILKTS
jgi:predicted nucleotidyltransferase component of viral defense system